MDQVQNMFCHQVRTQLFKIVTFEMDERTAFFALQVKMRNFFVAFFAHVLEAGGILFAKEILLNNAHRHKLFNLAIDSCNADRNVLLLEISRHVFCCEMAALHRFEAR